MKMTLQKLRLVENTLQEFRLVHAKDGRWRRKLKIPFMIATMYDALIGNPCLEDFMANYISMVFKQFVEDPDRAFYPLDVALDSLKNIFSKTRNNERKPFWL